MRTLLPRTWRRVLLASATVVALAAAGIAIADPGTPASTNVVSASFSTGAATNSHTETCTPTVGDAYTTTDAWYTSTASNTDPRFSGQLTIHAKSVVDTTKNLGSLKGDLEIQSSTTPPAHVHAHLTAVLVGTIAQGWLDGHLGDGSHFMGSFSASFSPTGGFTSFTFGAGNSTNAAIAWNGHCDRPNPPHPNRAHHDDHHGNDHGDHDH